MSLLRSYPYERETFCAMLGFKYRFYQREGGATASETPPTLYKLTAALIHESFVSVQDVYPLVCSAASSVVCVCVHVSLLLCPASSCPRPLVPSHGSMVK